MSDTCPVCESGKLIHKRVDEVQTVRNTQIMCNDLLVLECNNCHERAYSIEAIRKIEKRIEEVFPDYYNHKRR